MSEFTFVKGGEEITVTLSKGSSLFNQITQGTITASGGSNPAYDGMITNVSSNQLADILLILSVDSDPSFDSDYGFNYDYSQKWDDSSSQIDIELTINWDTDPGAGNDITIKYRVIERT